MSNAEGRRRASPHRISLRLPARLLRLPLKGGVIIELQTGNMVYTLDPEHALHRSQESGNKPYASLKYHSPLEGDSPPFVKRWGPVMYDLVSLAWILVGSPENRSESRGHRIEHRRRATPWRGGSGSGNAEAVRVEAGAVTQHGTGDVEEPIGHRTQGARMTVAAGA